MNKTMLDILACPMDRHHPLELFEISQKDGIISEGALYCTECSRHFLIIDGIPIMLPDELRDRKMETGFLDAHRDSLPEKITLESNPWHL